MLYMVTLTFCTKLFQSIDYYWKWISKKNYLFKNLTCNYASIAYRSKVKYTAWQLYKYVWRYKMCRAVYENQCHCCIPWFNFNLSVLNKGRIVLIIVSLLRWKVQESFSAYILPNVHLCFNQSVIYLHLYLLLMNH